MSDHKALIEKYAETYMAHQQYPIAETRAAMEEALADALEAATAVRAEVEVQALEQAATDLDLVLSMLDSANRNSQIDYGVYSEVHDVIAIALHHIEGARAVEIREGRA